VRPQKRDFTDRLLEKEEAMNASWRMKGALLAAALAVVTWGCMDRKLARIDPVTGSYVGDVLHNLDFEGVDILVVVDNSGSMEAEQRMLETAFPELVRSILTGTDSTGEIVHPPLRNLHVGVVSTDMGVAGYNIGTCDLDPLYGDDGILQNEPRLSDCDSGYPTFLSYEIGDMDEPDMAVVDRLSRDFGCIAVLGTDGCGFEQQLEAGRKALMEHSAPGGANAGFLRDNTILAVLFVTDEEDCSAADPTLFDTDGLPYSLNLRCYYESGKLHAIERYVEAFKGLRRDPDNDLVLGFIVGVPPGVEACNGTGDEIGDCLGLPEMGERVNGEGDLLEYVCMYPPGCTPGRDGDCTSEAFPARRFVQLAQQFGENAVVSSICADSFIPAVEALTERIQYSLKGKIFERFLAVDKDEDNPCRCVADCVVVEELADASPCPADKPPYDEDGDTVGDVKIDPETGQQHTLCEIPQAGAIINSGMNCDVDCDDPGVIYAMDTTSAGWWYDPTGDWDEDGEPDPTVRFTGVELEAGSTITIQCVSTICPELRQCGPAEAPDSKCCHADEYCYRPAGSEETEGYCLVRRDVCEGFGDGLWCPAAGPLAADPLIGGLCCLDPDMDGELDWIPVDEGQIPEDPAFRCEASTCVPR
jgi:hypothetical protein